LLRRERERGREYLLTVQCSVVVLSSCELKHTGFRHKRRNCSELKKELINSAEKSERERE